MVPPDPNSNAPISGAPTRGALLKSLKRDGRVIPASINPFPLTGRKKVAGIVKLFPFVRIEIFVL